MLAALHRASRSGRRALPRVPLSPPRRSHRLCPHLPRLPHLPRRIQRRLFPIAPSCQPQFFPSLGVWTRANDATTACLPSAYQAMRRCRHGACRPSTYYLFDSACSRRGDPASGLDFRALNIFGRLANRLLLEEHRCTSRLHASTSIRADRPGSSAPLDTCICLARLWTRAPLPTQYRDFSEDASVFKTAPQVCKCTCARLPAGRLARSGPPWPWTSNRLAISRAGLKVAGSPREFERLAGLDIDHMINIWIDQL